MAFLTQFMTILTTITVSWFNAILDVPLGADINDYADMVEAVIIVDGVAQSDIPYMQTDGVNRTFLSVVNTNIVRTYYVDFEAYFEQYDYRKEYTITFNVIDDIRPSIDRLPVFTLEVGSDPPDYEEGFYYSDNYDDIENLMISYHTNSVLYDVVGIYDITYTVMDTSLNETTLSSYVHIVDTTKPQIIQKKDFVIELGETYLMRDYFSVEDNYDQFIHPSMDESTINYDLEGSFEVTIKAIDQSGNQSELKTILTIIDVSEPFILLQTNPAPMTVYDEDALDDLRKFIISVGDGDDILNSLDVAISHDIQIDRIGSYHIFYHLTDDQGHEVNETLEIEVIDNVKPIITKKEDLVFPVFSPELFIASYFLVTDNYDEDVLDIQIETDIDYDKIGLYPIIVTAEDTSGNVSTYYDYIEIIDITPPGMTQINDIVITDFLPHVLDSYFDVFDNYDDKASLMITIDDHDVDYETLGIYPLTVHVSDTSGQITSYDTELFIIDVTSPIIELTKESLTISVHSEALHLYAYIQSVDDNYDDLTIDDVIIHGEVDVQTVGVYQITYEIMDSSGNDAMKVLTVYVDDFIAPTITFSNLTINQYDDINLLDGVTIYEETSSYDIMVFPSHIDTHIPGEQIITYICQDARGNYSMAQRSIVIIAHNQPYTFENFIPMTVILLTGGIIMVAIKKRG